MHIYPRIKSQYPSCYVSHKGSSIDIHTCWCRDGAKVTGRKLGFDGIVNLPSIRGQMSWEPSWDRHLGSVRGLLGRLCDSHPPTLFHPIGFIGFPTKVCKNNLLNVFGRNRAALSGLSEDNAFQFPKWCNWGSKLETIIVRFLSDRRNVNHTHTHLSRPSSKAKFSMKPLCFNPPIFFQTYCSTGCFCPLYGPGDPSELPNALRTLVCR